MPDCLGLDRHGDVRLYAARGRHLRLAVPNTCQNFELSGGPAGGAWSGGRTLASTLAQRVADPALGQLVLARDALGVDPEQDVDAMPGPPGYLGWVDAAVQPRRQAGMPQARLSELARRVRQQHERITLTRNGEAEAVLLSVDDLEGLEMTLEILGDREAVARISESLAALGRGEPGTDMATVRQDLARRRVTGT
jgi:antitoxin YefM